MLIGISTLCPALDGNFDFFFRLVFPFILLFFSLPSTYAVYDMYPTYEQPRSLSLREFGSAVQFFVSTIIDSLFFHAQTDG